MHNKQQLKTTSTNLLTPARRSEISFASPTNKPQKHFVINSSKARQDSEGDRSNSNSYRNRVMIKEMIKSSDKADQIKIFQKSHSKNDVSFYLEKFQNANFETRKQSEVLARTFNRLPSLDGSKQSRTEEANPEIKIKEFKVGKAAQPEKEEASEGAIKSPRFKDERVKTEESKTAFIQSLDFQWSGQKSSEAVTSREFYNQVDKIPCLNIEDQDLILDLLKTIPHSLQNYPPSRQETNQLSNWFSKKMSTETSDQKKEAICKLGLLECLRQFYVTYSGRSILMMEILQKLIKIQEDKVSKANSEVMSMRDQFESKFDLSKGVFEKTLAYNIERMASLQLELDRLNENLNKSKEKISEMDKVEDR